MQGEREREIPNIDATDIDQPPSASRTSQLEYFFSGFVNPSEGACFILFTPRKMLVLFTPREMLVLFTPRKDVSYAYVCSENRAIKQTKRRTKTNTPQLCRAISQPV